MTNLIVKLFIRDYQKTNDPAVRAAYGTLAGAVGIVTNLLVAVVKLVLGLLAASVSVMADAINNLSDAGSSLVTMVGFKLSGRPADREHPYGHARIEYLTGLFVSFIIVLLGGMFLLESVDKILNKSESDFSWLAIVILGISVAVKLWQGLFYRKLAKRIASASLIASATDSINDVISTTVVLAGAFVGKMTSWNIDGYVGIAVALFILVNGVKLVIETANPLLGQPPAKETVNALSRKILSYQGVIGLHDMIIHSYGANQIFCSVHVEVPADRDVMLSHDIIDNIEEDVWRDMGIHLVIHMDPITQGDARVDALRAELSEILSSLSPKLCYHDLRVVFGVTHDNLIFDLVLPMEFEIPEEEVVAKVTERLKATHPTINPKIKVDRDLNNMIE